MMDSGEVFHFNEWCFLAQVDPAAFERRRALAISDFLERSGRHRPRLESLQAVIDTEREQATTPTAAMLMISSKLQGSLCLLEEELKELSEDLNKLTRLSIAHRALLPGRRWSPSISRPRQYVRPLRRGARVGALTPPQDSDSPQWTDAPAPHGGRGAP